MHNQTPTEKTKTEKFWSLLIDKLRELTGRDIRTGSKLDEHLAELYVELRGRYLNQQDGHQVSFYGGRILFYVSEREEARPEGFKGAFLAVRIPLGLPVKAFVTKNAFVAQPAGPIMLSPDDNMIGKELSVWIEGNL